MARIRATATTAEVACTAATAKTVVQVVAAANHRIAIKGWSYSFDGVAGDAEPAVCVLMRQSTAGTLSSLTPTVDNPPITETLQTTALHTATAEPTSGDVLRRVNIHPQTGAEWSKAFDEEIIVPGGGRVGLVVTAPANVNVVASISYEE
jgi:hypothetical protein